MPRPRTTILKVPPMMRNRTLVPPQTVAVSLLSFDQSSPVTIGPVPSPSTGSLIVTEPLAKLPITPPRPWMVMVPRASFTDSVPSDEAFMRAAAPAGRASARASTANVRSRLMDVSIDGRVMRVFSGR